MNLGRFHAAIHALREEIDRDTLAQLIATLQATLQQSIAQPNPQTAQGFKDNYSKFLNVLQNSSSNNTFPTRQKIFDEIGGTPFIGIGLATQITAIFSENQITPANALEEIQKLSQQANQFYKRIHVIDEALGALNIEFDDLNPGEFEIGLSLPQSIVGTDVEALENEFHKISFALKTLQEVVGAGASSLKVKTISASEWQMYLEVVPELAGGLALAIERLVALYKNNLEIKKIKKELEEKNLPDNVLKPLQEHIETTVKSEIRKIAEELVDQYYINNDQGRKNELKNQTSQALRYLADRIDRGATIEVHAEPPEEPKTDSVDGAAQATEESVKKYEEMKELAKMVNEKTASTARLARSDEPILSIEYDKQQENK